MTDFEDCTCAGKRPLGSAKHLATCPLNDEKVVEIFRNGDTGRPVAVPDEVVSEAEREYRAYKAHLQGLHWEDIAHDEGYPSADAAAQAVRRYLQEGRAVVRDFGRKEIVAGVVGRLQEYRRAMWQGAVVEGKTTAMMALLAIEDRWIKVFGLDQAEAEDTHVQTVVVPDEGWLSSIRELVEAAEEAKAGDGQASAG